MKGVTVAALNGIGFGERLSLEAVCDRHTGISVGLLNYTRSLHGVQIGVLNHAANNPPWARWLPVLNVHL
jgi:hypothetical protein